MSSEVVQMEVKLIERFLGRREQVISEARKKAEEIIREAQERGKKAILEGRQDQMRITGTDLRAVRDKILGQSEQEGRRKIMELREAEVSRVFSEAENKLRAIAEGKDRSRDYHDILLKLILEAASAVGEKELVLAANKRDQRYLSRDLGTTQEEVSKGLGYEVKLLVEEEPIECLGGVVVYDRSRRKIYYNTLEARLRKARAAMGAQIAKVLKVI